MTNIKTKAATNRAGVAAFTNQISEQLIGGYDMPIIAQRPPKTTPKLSAKSVDQWIAAALARVALDQHADVTIELDCAAFVVELLESEREVAN